MLIKYNDINFLSMDKIFICLRMKNLILEVFEKLLKMIEDLFFFILLCKDRSVCYV